MTKNSNTPNKKPHASISPASNEQVVRWEGDYFPSQDEQLAKSAPKQFDRNLARDKKKQRSR